MPLKISNNKMIAGVCGGVAEWRHWDPTVVRIGYVLLSLLSAAFPGILVYVILWAICRQQIPKDYIEIICCCFHC